jgi:hypothetical protein
MAHRKSTKPSTNRVRRYDGCLCHAHATIREVRPTVYARDFAELGPEDEIECDMCSMRQMRAAGVL